MTTNNDMGRLVSIVESDCDEHLSEEQQARYNVQKCENCIFIDEINNEQFGCKFDRIKRLRELGQSLTYVQKNYILGADLKQEDAPHLNLKNTTLKALVTYHDGEIYDVGPFEDLPDMTNEVSYYMINGRYCNYYRNKNSDWAEKYKGEDSQKVVKQENQVKVSVILYVDKTTQLFEIQDALKSIETQTLCPVEVIVLNNKSPFDISAELNKLTINCTWRNVKTLWDDAVMETLFDDNMHHIKGTYFVLAHKPLIFPSNLIEKLETSLNVNLDQWLCVVGENLTISQSKVTRMLSGFCPIKPAEHNSYLYGLADKIKFFAQLENKTNMVRKLEDMI